MSSSTPIVTTGTDRTIAAADCPDMPTLRGQIDRVDRALLKLIGERTTYIARAAVLKGDRNTVHDQARIEDVVQKVKSRAAENGVPPALAEAVWRELIAQSIAFEFTEFDAKG